MLALRPEIPVLLVLFLLVIFSEGCFTVDKIARRLGVSRQMVKAAMREFEISTGDLMKARLVQTKWCIRVLKEGGECGIKEVVVFQLMWKKERG